MTVINANGCRGHGSMGADIFSDLCHKSSIWEAVSSTVAVSRSKQTERPPSLLFSISISIFFISPRWNIEQRRPTRQFSGGSAIPGSAAQRQGASGPVDRWSRRGGWKASFLTSVWLWKECASILGCCCLGYVTVTSQYKHSQSIRVKLRLEFSRRRNISYK